MTLHDLDRFVDGAAVRRVERADPLRMVQAITPELVAVDDEGAVCTQMLALYQVEGIARAAGALAATAVATGAIEHLGGGRGMAPRIPRRRPGTSWWWSPAATTTSRDTTRSWSGPSSMRVSSTISWGQEPGALRRFLDRVLGPHDDIVLFDYIKRNNREAGPALVGLEIGDREDLEPLMARMAASNMEIERVDPEDPIYRYLT